MNEIIKELKRINKTSPCLRIGQIIIIAMGKTEYPGSDPFYIEDKRLLQGLKKIE